MERTCKPGWYASRYASFQVKEAVFQKGVFCLKPEETAGLDDYNATANGMARCLGTDIWGPFKSQKEAEQEARFCGRDKAHVLMNENNFSRTEIDQARGVITELNKLVPEKVPAAAASK